MEKWKNEKTKNGENERMKKIKCRKLNNEKIKCRK